MNLSYYKSIVFDCDGVLLNSNSIKTKAFYEVCLPYGKKCAEMFAHYHKRNGGISRFVKIAHLVENILPKFVNQRFTEQERSKLIKDFLEKYSLKIEEAYKKCISEESLFKLRQKYCLSRWHVVSGGLESEVQSALVFKGLSKLFDGGIFGSPSDKYEIFTREISNGNISKPCLFIGDSIYDYEVSEFARLDFVFASYWTDVDNYASFIAERRINSVNALSEFLEV